MSTTSASKSTASVQSSITESSFFRVLLTPILFVSFLISLVLVDKSTYKSVLSGHSSISQSETYYHSHQRKLAKTEMDQAFRRRNQVLAVIFVGSGVGMAIIAWAGSAVWRWSVAV